MDNGKTYSNAYVKLQTVEDLMGTVSQPAYTTAGFPIGIIAIRLDYPKLPGNVVNASTFRFPVLYEEVAFEIEALFRGDEAIREQIVQAAVRLEGRGVRAIIGACGFFAHFQEDVCSAVKVPVYLSSLCQIPIIKTGLRKEKKIGVLAASGESVTQDLLEKVGADSEDVIVFDVGKWESFAPIRWGKTTLDNGALTKDLMALGERIRKEYPQVGAILLECSDLPPYAWAIQRASALPVFDFITLIRWVYISLTQQPYFGSM
jgi:hypothetical protein